MPSQEEPDIVHSLGLLDNGTLFARIEDKLKEMTQAVLSTGGKGKITLTFVVERCSENSVVVTPELKIAEPMAAKQGTTFYVKKDGSLTRYNPLQERLPMPGLRTE